MDEEWVIIKTADFAKRSLEKEGSGHDWWHVYRVWQNSIKIGKQENSNLFVVQLAALLHDIDDWKFNKGDESLGVERAKWWLESINVNEKLISHICEIIKNISFKGAGVKNEINTKEGEVVQDADRLDALGAIGIARCFAYGGHKGNIIRDPNIKPKFHKTKEEYLASGTQINHFYEKLLLLKGLMNTETGRKLAEKRHRFMEQYLEQFFREWDGKS